MGTVEVWDWDLPGFAGTHGFAHLVVSQMQEASA
jgi:hypothetical protein